MLRASTRVLTVAAVALAAAAMAGPAYYQKKATWQETMLASREALTKAEQTRLAQLEDPVDREARGFSPVMASGLSSRSKNVRRLRVRVRGVQCLWLSAAPSEGDPKLLGCWGEPVLVAKGGAKTPLRALKPVVSRGTARLVVPPTDEKQRKRWKGIRLGRARLEWGMTVKPGTELCYRLDGKYEMLEAQVGVAAAGNRNSKIDLCVDVVPLAHTLQRSRDRAALWTLVRRDFRSTKAQREMGREQQWRVWEHDWTPGERRSVASRYATALRSSPRASEAKALARDAASPADLLKLAAMAHRWQDGADAVAQAKRVNLAALGLAIDDLSAQFGARYPRGPELKRRLAALARTDPSSLKSDPAKAAKLAADLVAFQQEALLANPLLDFDKLLVVRRGAKSPKLGLPQNWQGNCALPRSGFDDAIAVMEPVRPGAGLTILHKPREGTMVADVDLHWDGDRIAFSSLDAANKWQVLELRIDPRTGAPRGKPRQITQGPITETDNYDPVYLPDDRIIFASAAVMAGVPCVGGKTPVSNLYLMDPDGANVRQLCFDQDHNWCPAVLNDGRVVYTRWEYTDTPHYFTRLLFHMKPDGTQQMELYGSNSYWPNSIFYARAIPGDPTKLVAVISGHHGVPRMGELVVFDTGLGRHQADGAVQRIPGYGKSVEPIIMDQLVSRVWPKFLHPWPLSDRYFLVACQPDSRSLWGIYLVDVFDNMLLLAETPGYALLEPMPLKARPRPPVIADRVSPRRKDGVVYLTDIYAGPGLDGVPRGTVKALRVFEWHYGYQRIGGHQSVTQEGGWDIKRILGTVPVATDGSALFRVPANTPLAVQPLDKQGRALQLMRSWFVAMPGEVLSCVGCHERQHDGTPNHHTLASQAAPRDIQPWYGPTRGFSFKRDVQPVLDHHCTRCHDGKTRPDGRTLPNFADSSPGWSGYTKSYLALHPYVRRPGPESDYFILRPGEYLANTSELFQKLAKGHHGVRLDPEAHDRLVTWADLNVPDFGTWGEKYGAERVQEQRALRAKFRKLYAGIDADPEEIIEVPNKPAKSGQPSAVSSQPEKIVVPKAQGWPFDAAEAKRRQQAAGPKATRAIELGSGVTMTLVLVPAGEFDMGDPRGDGDERPLSRVRIDEPFWIGRTEITNRQYSVFDPAHDSRYIDQHWKDHTTPGYPANKPEQPAIRVSWQRAVAFCRWLSKKTGKPFALPTEAEWEYACRAGSAKPFFFGGAGADYAKVANMGDVSLRRMAVRGVNPKPLANPSANDAYLPMDAAVNDGQTIVCEVGKYLPNAWGLHDMHGNVAEWTLSAYQPYPYRADDGRNQATADGLKVARGGSWRERAMRCRAAFRLGYHPWQPAYNVGFRVVCPARSRKVAAR